MGKITITSSIQHNFKKMEYNVNEAQKGNVNYKVPNKHFNTTPVRQR